MFDIMVKFQAQWRPGDPTPGVCPECREYAWRTTSSAGPRGCGGPPDTGETHHGCQERSGVR